MDVPKKGEGKATLRKFFVSETWRRNFSKDLAEKGCTINNAPF